MKKRINIKEAGVTLVALAVTIIVLLILAGIAISVSLGNNGVLFKAQNAKESYKQAERNDTQSLDSYSDAYKRATTNECAIYFDGQKQNLVPLFFNTDMTLLSGTDDHILFMNPGFYNVSGDNLYIVNANPKVEYIVEPNDLENTDLEDAIEIKKNDNTINVQTYIDEKDGETVLYNGMFNDYSTRNYFYNEIAKNRPHLYINGEDIGLEEWAESWNESEDREEYTNGEGSYLYVINSKEGILHYNKSGNPITINIKINDSTNNPSLELSGFNSSNLTEFKLQYDDGRTYDRNTKEFMYVIWAIFGPIGSSIEPDVK